MASTLVLYNPLSVDFLGSSVPGRRGTRGQHRTVLYNAGVDEEGFYSAQMPDSYLGEDLNFIIPWASKSASSGQVEWGVSFERIDDEGVDLDSPPTWGTEKTVISLAPGTIGLVQYATVSFTNAEIDGVAAGEVFRLRVRRLSDANVNDNMVGVAETLSLRLNQPGSAGTLTVEEQDGTPSVTGIRKIKFDNGTVTDDGGDTVSVSSGGGGGGFTIREVDGTPTGSCTTLNVSNGTLTDDGSGEFTLDNSGGGGGGGFFADGAGTDAAIGKGATAPTATGANSLAQGDNVDVLSDNSIGVGRNISIYSGQPQIAAFGRNHTCRKANSFFFGTYQTQNSNNNGGPWLMGGGGSGSNTEDFEVKRLYQGFGGPYYYYYGMGVIWGTGNNVTWRGFLDGGAPGYLPYSPYDIHAVNTVFVWGQNNAVRGGGNWVSGSYNTVGSSNIDQDSRVNLIHGARNQIYGGYGLVIGREHSATAGIRNFSIIGREGSAIMSQQHVTTTKLGTEDNWVQRFQLSGAVRTTSTTKTDILQIDVPINTAYLLNIKVLGKLSAAGHSGAIFALPTGAADVDGRIAIVNRNATTGIHLRNNTTTDATITFDLIHSDVMGAPVVTLEITTNSVTVRVTAANASNSQWQAVAECIQI